MKPVQIPLKPVLESAIDQNGVGAVVDMLRAICEERSGITHGKVFVSAQTKRFYRTTAEMLKTTSESINNIDPNSEANLAFVKVVTEPDAGFFVGPFISGQVAGTWAETRKRKSLHREFLVMTGREMRQDMAANGECVVCSPLLEIIA